MEGAPAIHCPLQLTSTEMAKWNAFLLAIFGCHFRQSLSSLLRPLKYHHSFSFLPSPSSTFFSSSHLRRTDHLLRHFFPSSSWQEEEKVVSISEVDQKRRNKEEMVNIQIRGRTKSLGGSPRSEIGEIDTRAPFQSVKAAVSLFGEVAVSRGRPATRKSKLSSENVIDKDSQLLLAQKELSMFKHQLESAESTKARADCELERAKRTEEELTSKLKTVTQSMESAKEAAEEVKSKAKKLEAAQSEHAIKSSAWKEELHLAKKEYTSTVIDLDAAKQELTKTRQDFDAALESKSAAFQKAAEAQRSAKLNGDRVRELSEEIAATRGAIEQLKLASLQAQEVQAAIVAEKGACLEQFKTAKEEAERKLASVKKDFDPQQTKFLEGRLMETSADIETLQEQMRKAHDSEMESFRAVTDELNEARKSLQKVAEEEGSLRNLVSFLRLELENVKKEQDELKKMQITEESSTPLVPKAEDEDSKLEIMEMEKHAAELKAEAEASRMAVEEAERELQETMKEAEEATTAEKRALSEMKTISGTQETDGADKAEESGKRIKLTLEEFETLSRKVEESENLAENEEATSMAKIEAIKASKEAADKKIEANMKAIEEIKAATEMAEKNAEMAESAKMVVEGELQRWRQEEQKVPGIEASSGHIYFQHLKSET